MKRPICILSLIILLGFKSSDKLTGKFYNHGVYDKVENYIYKSNGQFEYFAECEYKIYGHGNYHLERGRLILKYLTYDSMEKGHFDILGYKLASQYTDTIHFKIQDSRSNELLKDVVIHYKNTQVANLTSADGEVKIARLDKDLEIKKIGYRDLIITKDKVMDYGIFGFNIFLQDWLIVFKENLSDTIAIETISSDTLLLNNCLFVKDLKPSHIIFCE